MSGPVIFPLQEAGQNWYALYTCANHEKRISENLVKRSIEQFLPLYELVRRQRERKVRVQVPLFTGYVFVRIVLSDRLRVLQIPGVVRLVSFHGEAVSIPNHEIEALRRGLTGGVRAEPYRYLAVGTRVRVKSGPLCGLTGKLLRRKQNCRLVISIDSIARSIIAEVDLDDMDIPRVGNGARVIAAPIASSVSAEATDVKRLAL